MYKSQLQASLYSSNETKKQLTLTDTAIIDHSGYAELDLTHASSYVITIGKPNSAKPAVDADQAVTKPEAVNPSATVNPPTGDNTMAVLPVAALGLVALAVLIKRRRETE